MFVNCLLTAWKHLLPCLVSLITSNVIAGEPSSGPKSTPVRAAVTKANDDPFVGDYIGTVHPLGVHEGKLKPKDNKDFTPKTCGTCHTEAKIERSGAGYSLLMIVDHGNDKEGKPKRERFTLKADHQEKALSFSNGTWSITVAGGGATGGRLGRMMAEIKLKRKTELADKPASTQPAP